jgi:hypothetical protein
VFASSVLILVPDGQQDGLGILNGPGGDRKQRPVRPVWKQRDKTTEMLIANRVV